GKVAAVRPGNLDRRNSQIDVAGIRERHNLWSAGDADGLVPKVPANWREHDNGSLHDLVEHRRSAGCDVCVAVVGRCHAVRSYRERGSLKNRHSTAVEVEIANVSRPVVET